MLYFPRTHLLLIAVLTLIATWVWQRPPQTVIGPNALESAPYFDSSLNPGNTPTADTPIILEEMNSALAVPQLAVTQAPKKEDKVAICKGDTLSSLFERYNIGQATLFHILSADESLLALETLRPGHILFFRYHDNTGELSEMELHIHAGHHVSYQRIDDGTFIYDIKIQEGEWHSETVSGSIEGSFYLSALRVGLSEGETVNVTQIFKDQINFARAIRKDDKFQVVRDVQFVDGEPTGQTRISSARIQRRKFEHTAYLFQDGRYYDKDGSSLARAFARTPLSKSYRISSRFNARRIHPVTGRVQPHNGTDFATPTGTKVLTTGDGVVSRVGNHRFAGRYIDIKHGGEYKTRYLHLHRILVQKGESVKRGQVIALSGNTGRSTGPHLHFELHINGRPVDPMKADIPLTQSIAKKDESSFLKLVEYQTRLLDNLYKLADRKETKLEATTLAASEDRVGEFQTRL